MRLSRPYPTPSTPSIVVDAAEEVAGEAGAEAAAETPTLETIQTKGHQILQEGTPGGQPQPMLTPLPVTPVLITILMADLHFIVLIP